jgi:release factor H-coupled RctB family protein
VTTKSSAELRLIASPKNWIEGSAVEQLKKTAQLPGMRLAVGLPDLHPGKGSPIGAVFLTDGWLYPALVGSDIGCGIGLWRTEMGTRKIKPEAWADRLRNLDHEWDGDAGPFLERRGVHPAGFEMSLGTIGSGNHFAELQAIESIANQAACDELGITAESVYLCVHSGSRGFGEAILRGQVERFAGNGLAAESNDAEEYLAQHEHAKRWAGANRELIAVRVLEKLATEGTRLIDICHNSVEREGGGWLHRKGAAPSTQGPVVIPGSRGAFSYVVLPKQPGAASGFSLAHGAGRKWSRSDSRGRLEKRFSAKDLLRTELGSHVICDDKDLLYEEAPQAYKNISIVIDDLVRAGLVEVIVVLKPLVTYKVRR